MTALQNFGFSYYFLGFNAFLFLKKNYILMNGGKFHSKESNPGRCC